MRIVPCSNSNRSLVHMVLWNIQRQKSSLTLDAFKSQRILSFDLSLCENPLRGGGGGGGRRWGGKMSARSTSSLSGLSAGTGKLCIFGHLGLVFIWSCVVPCLLLLLYYVICAPVLTEGTNITITSYRRKIWLRYLYLLPNRF